MLLVVFDVVVVVLSVEVLKVLLKESVVFEFVSQVWVYLKVIVSDVGGQVLLKVVWVGNDFGIVEVEDVKVFLVVVVIC